MQIINLFLWAVGFFLSLLLIICLFIFVFPCAYTAEGTWQDKLKGIIIVICGPLKFQVMYGENERKSACFSFLGIKCIDLAGKQNNKQQNKQKHNNESVDHKEEKRKKGMGRKELEKLFEGGMLKSIIEFCIKIMRQLTPTCYKISGRLGFADPYHTGLLAAVLAAIPPMKQIEIATDFSGEVRDVMFQVQGKFILAVLIYYTVRMLFTGSLKSVLWTSLKKKTT